MKLDEILGKNSSDDNHLPLGEILLRRGQIRRYQLDFMLQLQKSYQNQIHRRIPLGELLIKHRAVFENSVRDALVLQRELPQESITQIVARLDLELDDGDETKLLPTRE